MLEKEEEIIKGIINGNEAAFKQLVDALGKKVYNTCLGFLPKPQDAEDITQEVFVEVYRSITKFQGRSSLSTWVYRIAVTKCLDHIKATKRVKRFAFVQSLFGANDELRHDLPKDFKHPGVQMEEQEKAGLLFAAIEKLPLNQRTAFVLVNVDGLSYKEAAEVMEISLSSVESLIFRAKKTLQQSLYKVYKDKY